MSLTSESRNRNSQQITWNVNATSFRPSYVDNECETSAGGSGDKAEVEIVHDVIPPLVGAEKAHFELLRGIERGQHSFTPYYTDEKSSEKETLTFLGSLAAGSYTHQHAIDFIAKARSVWMHRDPPTVSLPSITNTVLVEFDDVPGTHALYRVLAEKPGKYILIACHMNVHGLHRGDLRFIEVNSFTKLDGNKHSCIRHLVVGDILGVTELSKTCVMPDNLGDVDVSSVTQETPCVWMARSIVLMRRTRFSKVPFCFIQNGTAISPSFGKSLTVKLMDGFFLPDTENKVFVGSGVLPRQITSEFAGELYTGNWRALKQLTSTVAPYPAAVGVVTDYELDDNLTRQFNVGTNAFKEASVDSDDIVELCVLMGQSAVHVILSDGFDSRSFQMMSPRKEGTLVRFSIPNTPEQMTEVLWRKHTRILIGSSRQMASAIIESTIVYLGQLSITARLSNKDLGFEFTDKIHIVQQLINPSKRLLGQGFFKNLPSDSNGRLAIETLYGGPSLNEELYDDPRQFHFASSDAFKLNREQNEYVTRMLNGTPLTVASAPFGSGKSVTIAVAAIQSLMTTRKEGVNSQNVIVTQSHYASVNLVDIISRFKFQHSPARIVRFIGEYDWIELPDSCKTSHDLPHLMTLFFTEYAKGTFTAEKFEDLVQMVLFLTDRNLIDCSTMCRQARDILLRHLNDYRYSYSMYAHLLFKIVEPEIIIATADTLPDLLHELKDVSTAQFDEASQVPESTLISVFSKVPNACFGLVGDIRQLPPYCNDGLHGHLKKYGIGSTMQRTVASNLFPQLVLQFVYRCHPVTTSILGDLFYDQRLVSGVTEEDRNEFMTKRPDIWPNSRFPILVRNNNQLARKVGTSIANDNEIKMVYDLVCQLMTPFKGFALKPIEIGVISFYKAQESLLTEVLRGTHIKCGTVDAFQGSEREVMIVCCTSEYVSAFLANKNRINVAMSRAKQATIIIAHSRGLMGDPNWRVIIRKAQESGCSV